MDPETGRSVEDELRLANETIAALRHELREQQVRQRRFRLTQYAVDHAGEMCLWAEPDGRIIYANQVFCRKYGVSAEHIAGINIADVVEQFSFSSVKEPLNDKYHCVFETTMASLQGDAVPVEITIYSIEFESAQYLICFGRDISEQRQIQQRLRASEERFDLALQASADGLWDWDMSNGSVYFSPRWMTMLEYEPDELPQTEHSWSELLHPDEREAVINLMKRSIATKQSDFQFESRMRTKSGAYRWILSRGMIIADERTGTPCRLIGTHRDITERKRMEQSLVKSEMYFRDFFENGAVGFHILRPDWGFSDINNTGLRILGYSREEIVGAKTWPEVIIPEDRQRFFDSSRRLADGEQLNDCEYTVVRRDGTHREVLVSASPCFGADGGMIGVNCSVQDITDKKELERFKDSLIHMLVHDLNNPLFVVTGRLEFIQLQPQDNLTLKQKENIELALLAARDLKGMVADLLDLNRMESGKIKLLYERFSLTELTRQVVMQMNVVAAINQRTLALDVAEEMPELSADKDLVKRIISNLINNAIKFSPPGDTVQVMVRHEQTDRGFSIKVKDRGRGIAKEHLERIFDKFVRVESKDAPAGRGLGLAFCKMAVEAHGGRIWAESEPGKGSLFTVTIPERVLYDEDIQ